MNELSLHILDIAQNSVTAGAKTIKISILADTAEDELTIKIEDDGCGMGAEMLKNVISPFTTSRKTRKVGLGVPLLKMTAEMTGGRFSIDSEPGRGTDVEAVYIMSSVDCLPIGDMASTMTALVQQKPDIRFVYIRAVDDRGYTLDTLEVSDILEGLPLDTPEVLGFMQEYIAENEKELMEVQR